MTNPDSSCTDGNKRIISVTHFLPYYATATNDDEEIVWKLEKRKGHSAMYAGIRSIKKLEAKDSTISIVVGCIGNYIDLNNEEQDSFLLSEKNKNSLREILWLNGRMIPVFMDEYTAANHYDGYCKQGILIITSI
ncbi:hypothetical protein AYI70_g11021 [Smittium culicis]|uniref:Uncharacterized protein n=1 Tax=Smittium culicis TaxID=133412 RepID=A0A1R1X3M1_9FUNG|nr:hypothetical protein AYI70_g11021 [Smittium culicis]